MGHSPVQGRAHPAGGLEGGPDGAVGSRGWPHTAGPASSSDPWSLAAIRRTGKIEERRAKMRVGKREERGGGLCNNYDTVYDLFICAA